jgi:hypothetical protein
MPNKKCVKLYTSLTHFGNAIRNNLIIPYFFLPVPFPLSLPLAIKVAPKKLLKFIYTTVDYIKHYLFIKQDLGYNRGSVKNGSVSDLAVLNSRIKLLKLASGWLVFRQLQFSNT